MEARQAAQTRQQVAALYQAHALGLVTNGTFKPVRFPLTAVPFAGEIAF
jgi:hypothetical protein